MDLEKRKGNKLVRFIRYLTVSRVQKGSDQPHIPINPSAVVKSVMLMLNGGNNRMKSDGRGDGETSAAGSIFRCFPRKQTRAIHVMAFQPHSLLFPLCCVHPLIKKSVSIGYIFCLRLLVSEWELTADGSCLVAFHPF